MKYDQISSNQDIVRRIDGNDGKRWYRGIKVDHEGGEHIIWEYPSYTTVLDATYPMDQYLVRWIRDQGIAGQAIFEKAGEEGTEVHIAIESLIYGKPMETLLMSDKVKSCVQAFVDWATEFKPKFIDCETIVSDEVLRTAGTRDLLCELNYTKGKTAYVGEYIVDFKSSTSVQEKHYLQVAGYWGAHKNRDKTKTAILHLNSRNKCGYGFYDFDPHPKYSQFMHFRKTFDIIYPDAKPVEKFYPSTFELPQELTIKM